MAKAPTIYRPGQKVADWEAAYDEFLSLKRATGITREKYAEQIGCSYDYVCSNFSEIKRKRIDLEIKSRLPVVMQKALRQVQQSLDDEVDFSPAKDRAGIGAEFKRKHELAVLMAVADRMGYSPQAVTVQVSQTNQQAIVLPPIFAGNYEQLADSMLKGANGTPEAND